MCALETSGKSKCSTQEKKKRGLKNEAELKFKATAVTVVMANTLLTLFIFATSSGFDTQRASFTLNLLCVAVAQASRRQP